MRKKYRPLTSPVRFDWSNPFKFQLGAHVYVWGFDQTFSFRILSQSQLGPAGFPHYVVSSHEGEIWTVPQLHLSTRPLT